MANEDIVPSPETDTLEASLQTLAFEAWFDRFCNECKALCYQNIGSLYHNSPNQKFAQKQFNECYQEIIQKAKNIWELVSKKQGSPEFLREQRKLLEQMIMTSTSTFIQCLRAFRKQPVAIKLNDFPGKSVYTAFSNLIQERDQSQLEKFFIKEAADSFEGWTTLYLTIFQAQKQLTSEILKSYTTCIKNASNKHIKTFKTDCESGLCRQAYVLYKEQLKGEDERLIEKDITKKIVNFLQPVSRLNFQPRFSEIPIVKKYTNEIHKKTPHKSFADLQNEVKKNFRVALNGNSFGMKILMLIDIRRQNNSIGKNKLKTAITSEEWKWCTRELSQKLSMQLKESKETAAKFLDDRTFDAHIKDALNTLFEEVLVQTLLKENSEIRNH